MSCSKSHHRNSAAVRAVDNVQCAAVAGGPALWLELRHAPAPRHKEIEAGLGFQEDEDGRAQE